MNISKKDFDKKIFVCSLGIVLITLLLYVFEKKFMRIIEPVPTDFFDIPSFIQAISAAIMQAGHYALSAFTLTKNTLKAIADKAYQKFATALTAAYAKAGELKNTARFAKTQATTAAATSANFAKQNAIQAQNRAGQVAMAVKSEAKSISREAKVAAKVTKTFKTINKVTKKVWPVLKWGFRLMHLLHGIGTWGLKTIDTLIYRLFHFKDCFLWYSLEIIGYILYLPFEFIVWLLCLQSLEKTFWEMIDSIDCFFYDSTGFHIFHYSDTIIKKCYSKKFPPFPYTAVPFEGDGEFDEKAFMKMILDWYLPPSPSEMKDAVKMITEEIRKPESKELLKDTTNIIKDEIGELFKIPTPNPNEVKEKLGDVFDFNSKDIEEKAKQLFGSGIKLDNMPKMPDFPI